jgi:hypothetical protein
MLDETFKRIEGKAKASERYVIDPEEIARYTGTVEAQPELVGSAIQ